MIGATVNNYYDLKIKQHYSVASSVNSLENIIFK